MNARVPTTLTNWTGRMTPGGGLIGPGRASPSAAMRCSIFGMSFSAMGSATGWSFELDNVAFRVGDVDRRTFSFRSVARGDRPRFDVVRRELAADGRFIE